MWTSSEFPSLVRVISAAEPAGRSSGGEQGEGKAKDRANKPTTSSSSLQEWAKSAKLLTPPVRRVSPAGRPLVAPPVEPRRRRWSRLSPLVSARSLARRDKQAPIGWTRSPASQPASKTPLGRPSLSGRARSRWQLGGVAAWSHRQIQPLVATQTVPI